MFENMISMIIVLLLLNLYVKMNRNEHSMFLDEIDELWSGGCELWMDSCSIVVVDDLNHVVIKLIHWVSLIVNWWWELLCCCWKWLLWKLVLIREENLLFWENEFSKVCITYSNATKRVSLMCWSLGLCLRSFLTLKGFKHPILGRKRHKPAAETRENARYGALRLS